MKKILIYIGIMGLFFSACNSFLEEENKSNVSTDDYYKTVEGFEALVNAAYGTLRDVYGGDPYLFCAGTDMYVEGRNYQPPGLSEYRFLSPSEDEAGELYISGFQSIQTCNMALNYSDIVENYSELGQRIGELKYLRANYYFLLVQTYGGVTLTTEFINSPILAFNRNADKEVYAFIIQELEEAKNLVAEGAFDGRVNKRAILHLLAKVYLTRGYESFAVSDDFSKAASYADAAINGQKLDIPFDELWVPGNENNAEVIFSVQYDRASIAVAPTELGNAQGSFFGASLGGGSEQAGRAPYKTYTLCPTMYFFDRFSEGDSRLEASVMMYIYVNYWDFYKMSDLSNRAIYYYYAPQWAQSDEQIQAWRDENPETRSATKVIKYDNWEADKEVSSTENFLFPVIKKFDDPDASYGTYTSARDIVLSRLGETYLIASEAYLKAGDPGTALDRLNEVRRRAAKSGYDLSLSSIDIDVILDERAAELVGEYHRWFDLKRTGTLIERCVKYNKNIEAVNFEGKNGNSKILRPIPQEAIDLNQNKNFQQNPAY